MNGHQERTNLWMILVALLVAIIGSGLLWISGIDALQDTPALTVLIRNIGALLIVSVAVSVIWELVGKRAFLDEILSKAQLSTDVVSAGIERAYPSFKDINWDPLLEEDRQLDIFLVYGRTWRRGNWEKLEELVSRENGRLRVILPDPEDETTVAELARKFDYTEEKLVERIREAQEDFADLEQRLGDVEPGDIEIWFLPYTPVYSFYRFQRRVIIAFYNQRVEMFPVPTFLCSEDGFIYEYVTEELEAMVGPDGLARQVYPEEG